MASKRDRESYFRRFLERMRRFGRREPDLPGDPYAYRMAPVRSGSKGSRGAAAVAEPGADTGSFFPPRT